MCLYLDPDYSRKFLAAMPARMKVYKVIRYGGVSFGKPYFTPPCLRHNNSVVGWNVSDRQVQEAGKDKYDDRFNDIWRIARGIHVWIDRWNADEDSGGVAEEFVVECEVCREDFVGGIQRFPKTPVPSPPWQDNRHRSSKLWRGRLHQNLDQRRAVAACRGLLSEKIGNLAMIEIDPFRPTPVPTYLFHGTTEDRLDLIELQGLQPDLPLRLRRWQYRKDGVYLAYTLQEALYWARTGRRRSNSRLSIAVLRVKTSLLVADLFRKDPCSHGLFYVDVIPWECIDPVDMAGMDVQLAMVGAA